MGWWRESSDDTTMVHVGLCVLVSRKPPPRQGARLERAHTTAVTSPPGWPEKKEQAAPGSDPAYTWAAKSRLGKKGKAVVRCSVVRWEILDWSFRVEQHLGELLV